MQEANHTYVYIHAIWCTGNKQKVLSRIVRKVLFPYAKQHASSKGIQLLAVNGHDDHVHCLLKLMPVQSVHELVKQLKADTAEWLNDNRLLNEPFGWEDSYTAYSVSPSTADKSADYINRQEEYHETKTLEEEMAAFEKMVGK